MQIYFLGLLVLVLAVAFFFIAYRTAAMVRSGSPLVAVGPITIGNRRSAGAPAARESTRPAAQIKPREVLAEAQPLDTPPASEFVGRTRKIPSLSDFEKSQQVIPAEEDHIGLNDLELELEHLFEAWQAEEISIAEYRTQVAGLRALLVSQASAFVSARNGAEIAAESSAGKAIAMLDWCIEWGNDQPD